MSESNHCLIVFLNQSRIYVEANMQAAKKQQKLMHHLSRIVRRCATVGEVQVLVNRKMQALVHAEESIDGDDPETHGCMVQSLKNRQLRLRSKVRRMSAVDGATPALIAAGLHWHADAIMCAYASSGDAYNAVFSVTKPETFMGTFKTMAKAEMERCLKPALLRLRNQADKREAHRIACGELNQLCKELGKAWEWWLNDDQASPRITRRSDGLPCFLSEPWPDDADEGPFADVPDVDDAPEMPAPSVNQINICKHEDVKNCLASLKGNNKVNDMDRKILQEMDTATGMALHAPIPLDYKSIMGDFRARFPNMLELGDLIEGRFNLLTMGGEQAPAMIANNMLILDGPPGAGKTVAVRYLAKRLGIEMLMLAFADMTNGFDLSGQTRGYGTGRMGQIARHLMGKKVSNQFLVLDEIDKGIEGGSNSSPYQPLYTLLERESAAHFRDEFLEFEIDASKINWLATSNYYKQIPEPIRDRATRIYTPQPNEQQRMSIVRHLYQDLLAKNRLSWGRFFVPEIDESVIGMLAGIREISIRRLVDMVEQCAVAAAGKGPVVKEAGTVMVDEDDVASVIRRLNLDTDEKQPIGFIH